MALHVSLKKGGTELSFLAKTGMSERHVPRVSAVILSARTENNKKKILLILGRPKSADMAQLLAVQVLSTNRCGIFS
jgi:hypothetical protein